MTLPSSIAALIADYAAGTRRPREVVREALQHIARDVSFNAWIHVVDETYLEPWLARLDAAAPADLPLYGVPFAIKDNIDLAGVPTTAACAPFAYCPSDSAPVVQRLLEAGALPLGKTNLDQFATGLVGTRSPYGEARNPRAPDYVSGGSSSGSAVACTLGHVFFALGTDTAGSGRVPAAAQGLVGYKPSPGLLSTRGVVPACRSLDCVSVFADSVDDVRRVQAVAGSFDPEDAFARPLEAMRHHSASPPPRSVLAIPLPAALRWFGSGVFDDGGARAFAAACERLSGLGFELRPADVTPFLEAGTLLYGGPWLAERWLALRAAFAAHPEVIDPVLQKLLPPGAVIDAASTFAAQHRLRELQRAADTLLASVHSLVLPTIGGLPTHAEVAAQPIARNAELGYYTTSANLLDLAVVAVPAGNDALGVPFGISFLARAGADADLLDLAASFLGEPVGIAAADDELELIVCGAHMRGLPLAHQLTSRGGRFLREVTTAADYRLFALPSAAGAPERPGLVRVPEPGTGVAVTAEAWALPRRAVGDFLSGIPSPLGLGRVRLADGQELPGFLCEAAGAADAVDISTFGGFRGYLARR